jgi:hypothetical protein
MFKKLLETVFRSKQRVSKRTYLIVQVNDRIMPIGRGDIYEDPLDEFLKANDYGNVTGGGTLQESNGEIKYCDLEIEVDEDSLTERMITSIIAELEVLGVPKKSKLIIEYLSKAFELGTREGLAVYLDGVNLPSYVYAECDSNYVMSELKRLIGDDGTEDRYWQGEAETAFYFYGKSYIEMKKSIEEFVNNYPLCQGCRIVQIA